MDGSTSAFLYDTQFSSSPMDDYSGGILYIEDFDAELRTSERPVDPGMPDTPAPLTQADLDLARSEGRVEGIQSALADAEHSRAQMEAAALHSLSDSFAAARVSLERVASQHAAEAARIMLAMMSAAVPATMAGHGGFEIEAMLHALLPGLLCEPELRVRTHPGLADTVRDRLSETLSHGGVVLSVVADAKLGSGDIELAWQRGRAGRDCQSIWTAIRSAMSPLSLPPITEVCSHGS